MIEHRYEPVDFDLWDVLHPVKRDIISLRLKNIVLLHIFGDRGTSAIFVTADDVVYATGNDQNYRLGISQGYYSNSLHELSPLRCQNVKCFSSGETFTLALTKDGRIFSWGSNDYGQLGRETERLLRNNIFPDRVQIKGSEPILAIACGYNSCLALSYNKRVYEWGHVTWKSVSESCVSTPTLISNPKITQGKILQISCHGYINAALNDGYTRVITIWGQEGVSNFERIVDVSPSVDIISCSGIGCIFKTKDGKLKTIDNTLIAEADDFVVQDKLLCYRKGNNFYVKWHHDSPKLVDLNNFQSAFANYACPQFIKMDPSSPPVKFETKTIYRSVYEYFFNKKELSDLTIKLKNGKIFYVQKLNLMGLCDHFKKILTGPWADMNSTQMDMTVYNPVAYEVFLKYIYSGNLVCDELTIFDLIDLYSIADSYFENDLKIKALDAFKNCLTVENVSKVYSLAEKHKELMEECLNFASVQVSSIVLTESYNTMEPELARTFIKDCCAAKIVKK